MLQKERIYLRPLEREDLASRVKWVNDPETRKTLMFDYPLSLAKTQKWFDQILMDKTKINFSIVDVETDKLIGMTGLLNITPVHGHAQLYITIGEKEYWGKKLADEVISAVLEYGFIEVNLRKIYLYTIPSNERGRKVYERNGFVKEGVLKEHYFCVGAYQDLCVHAVMKEKWLKTVNK